MDSRKILAAAVVVGLVCALPSHAAETESREPVSIGYRASIQSDVLGEERKLLIAEPQGYASGDLRYPVLYLLDGDANFHHTTGAISNLQRGRRIPPMFVVAISNVDRQHDFTLPSRDEVDRSRLPTQGGAPEFLQFLTHELDPWIDDNYRTHPFKILVGHSLGGLFAVNALLDAPTAFDAYIVISPALGWDSQKTVERADAFFRKQKRLDKSLYLGIGGEGGTMLDSTRELASVLGETAAQDFEWAFRRMPDENHFSVPLPAIYQGLELIFSHWTLGENPLDLYDRSGMTGIHNFFRRADERYKIQRGTPASALTNLVGELLARERFDESSQLLKEEGVPKNPYQLDYLADAYLKAGETRKAVEVLTRLYRVNPSFARTVEKLEDLGVDIDDL